MEHALRSVRERMAYLNVRERRLEAQIVYVGPLGAGKATNLEQLGRRISPQSSSAPCSVSDDAGEVFALEWGSESVERFRDCQLFARVMAPRGPMSAERTRALLRDVDGVVLVVDATPSAREENRACAALLRDALADAKRNVAVVVQVNKTDSEEALPSEAILRDLDAPWPHVEAAAARGEGVVETVERALAEVLAALREHPPEGASTGVTVRTEGNPLLDALRQVLRETVAEHVAELEERFVAKLDSALEIAALRKTLVDESARTRSSVDTLRTTVSSSVSETTRALAAHSGAISALERRFLEENEVVTKLDALRTKVDALAIKVDRVSDIRRAVDQIAADVREARDAEPFDPRPHLTALDQAVAKLGRGVTEEVHDARDLLVAHVVGLEEQARGSGQSIADVSVRLTELTEELKKKEKKGWFG